MKTVYGKYRDGLVRTLEDLTKRIEGYNKEYVEEGNEPLFYHLITRIKDDGSMTAKLDARGLPHTPEAALAGSIYDACGIRIVCCFIKDIFENIKRIRELPGVKVIREKDYLANAKPNGYRSYHMIISVEEPYADALGNCPGIWYAEIQLRTIAMDSWAALEHKMKYKKTISDNDLIVSELRRCADELAACDISMQTINDMINNR